MKSILSLALAVALAAAVFAAQPANTSRPCRTWVDPELRVRFPGTLGGLALSARRVYDSGNDDYTLRYDPAGDASADAGRLDLYICCHDGEAWENGADELAVAEVCNAADALLKEADGGACENVEKLGMTMKGRLEKCGLKFCWTSAAVKPSGPAAPVQVIFFVTAWRERALKLRYSEPVSGGIPAPCEELPKGLLSVLADLDAVFAGAIAAGKADVYTIDDPAEALAALRRKWLGADIRVPMSDLPDYEERALEFYGIQRWCRENIVERADTFEAIAREGVKLRIEPPVWHYDLACVLARQGRAEEAFVSLEQAVAAGWNRVAHMNGDADLESLRGDARFAKLAAMAQTIKENWDEPRETAKVRDGRLQLDEDNVQYAFDGRSYLVEVETDAENPVVYLDHCGTHRPPPAEGMIGVEFAEPFRDARRDAGAANIHFMDLRKDTALPTALLCDAAGDGNPLCGPQSIPAAFPLYGEDRGRGAQRELHHFAQWNTLGFYAAGGDFGKDGIDRFIGHFPACVAYVGGREEGEGFVRLYRDIVAALPEKHRGLESQIALNVIRHAQKCVTDEAAFMSGIAQRPVLSLGDIDCARAVADARTLADSPPPVPFVKDFTFGFSPMRANGIFEGDCGRTVLSESACHGCVVASWGDKVAVFNLAMHPLESLEKDGIVSSGCRYEWRVLQGDAGKVRIGAQDGSAANVKVEIGCHAVFDAPLANGNTVKSSRVDVGCFIVDKAGRASVPAVFSVYFSPNETREYGADGRLLSIDYAKRQLEGWRPRVCAKGNWKDVFRYTADGQPDGWTRYAPAEGGSVATNDFTREGLVVVTRDARGRPQDARRDLKAEWAQDFEGGDFADRAYAAHHAQKGIEYDRDGRDPGETTLSWEYTYADGRDFFGTASPKPARPFAYRPEMNRRAEFTAESGFRLPLVDQMLAGYARYEGLKYGSPAEGDARDLRRADGPPAPEEKGLTPPKTPKKMAFCPWKPSTNDLWRVDADDFETAFGTNLVELADGVYRCRRPGRASSGGEFFSVSDTFRLANMLCERIAYESLDETYARGAGRGIDGENGAYLNDGPPMLREDLPEGAEVSEAYWQLSAECLFTIVTRHHSGFSARSYVFDGRHPGEDGTVTVSFAELPSRAIGNTVLRAFAGEADALNNLAVLLYAEVAEPGAYEEEKVRTLLELAAGKGNPTAKRNLEVFYRNRGPSAP